MKWYVSWCWCSIGCVVDIKDNMNLILYGDVIWLIVFNVEGFLFVIVGDDKWVKLWDVKIWMCIKIMYIVNLIVIFVFLKYGCWLIGFFKEFSFWVGNLNFIFLECLRFRVFVLSFKLNVWLFDFRDLVFLFWFWI